MTGAQRPEPVVEQIPRDRPLGHPAPGHRQPVGQRQPHRQGSHEQPAGHPSGHRGHPSGQPRGEVVERLARHQDQPADAVRAGAAVRDQQLRERAAGVAADQRDAVEATPGTTKDRLVTAGLRLFARQGFRATTVGEIEAAAGLQPRRGALYRHFPSKDALLAEAVQRHLDSVRARRTKILGGEPGDPREEALALGRFVLDELDSQREIVDVFEHEGDRVAELRDTFREQVSDVCYRVMAEALRRWIAAAPPAGFDLDGAAVLLLGALINVHRSTWTFAGAPLGLDEHRILTAWAEQCATVVTAARRAPG